MIYNSRYMQNSEGYDGRRFLLISVSLTSFLMTFMASSVNIALPSIGKEFSMNAVSLSWVNSIYLLTIAAFIVIFGKIADLKGRKKTYNAGMFIYAAGTLLVALSTSSLMLIICRFIQGTGASLMIAPGIALISSVYPTNGRGRALGIYVSVVYLGHSLGPVIGGVMTQNLGWRSLFYASFFLMIIAIVISLLKMKGEWTEGQDEKFDYTGSVIVVLTLTAITYGLSILPSLAGILTTVAGIIGVFVFIWWEKKLAYPLININIFRQNRSYAFSNLSALICHTVTYAVAFLISLFLQYIKGFDAQTAGIIMLALPSVQVILSVVIGRLSDRMKPHIISSAGMMLLTLGLFLFIFLNEDSSVGFIVLVLVLHGFGLALFIAPNVNLIMNSVDDRYYGAASSTVATMRNIGIILSMGIVMMLLSILLGSVEISAEYFPDFISAVKLAFIIFSVICFIGIFISLKSGETQKGK